MTPFDAEQDRRDEYAELSAMHLAFKLAPAMSTADDSPLGALIPMRPRKRRGVTPAKKEYMRTRRVEAKSIGLCGRCRLLPAVAGGSVCRACIGDSVRRREAASALGMCRQHVTRPVATKRNGKPALACSECLVRYAAKQAARRAESRAA